MDCAYDQKPLQVSPLSLLAGHQILAREPSVHELDALPHPALVLPPLLRHAAGT